MPLLASPPPRAAAALAAVVAAALAAVLLATAPGARAEPVFAAAPTEGCVNEVVATSIGRGGHRVLDCAGKAAQACMMTPGGDTTYGMIECLSGELGYWEARMNAAMDARRRAAATADAELAALGSAAPPLTPALEAMAERWAAFREAACFYEQAQWMGGTGGGPATLACYMHETARQALRLEGWWGE